MEGALNQPTLPHVVIALNATDVSVDQIEWDPEQATKSLLVNVAGAIYRDPKYQAHMDFWTARGKTVRSLKDLLECVYSTVTVVRIPVAQGRYMMLDDQVRKLRGVLTLRCSKTFTSKSRSRALADSESLNIYLQCAFDHFSQYLATPFDFQAVSASMDTVSGHFEDNVLHLAVAKMDLSGDPRVLFKHMAFMVASCILLHSVRHEDGKAFSDPLLRLNALETQYLAQCEKALDEFFVLHWPCMFMTSKHVRCVNVQAGHSKGHQNKEGKILGIGSYQCDLGYSELCAEWIASLQMHLQQQGNVAASEPYHDVKSLHRLNVDTYYSQNGGVPEHIKLPSTCFCCLGEPAHHSLPCAHAVCTPCIKDYGAQSGPGTYYLVQCPLHVRSGTFNPPAIIQINQPTQGDEQTIVWPGESADDKSSIKGKSRADEKIGRSSTLSIRNLNLPATIDERTSAERSTKSDEETEWCCCRCGIGPYKESQSVCITCHHEKCDSCKTSETNDKTRLAKRRRARRAILGLESSAH